MSQASYSGLWGRQTKGRMTREVKLKPGASDWQATQGELPRLPVGCPVSPTSHRVGVPIKVVSERLGHSSPGFTMATYQHVIPGMQAEAAQTFADILERRADLPPSTR